MNLRSLNIKGVDIVGVYIVILILGCLIWVLRNDYLENFIVTVNELVIPSRCPDYLVTDGRNHYLINSRKVFDGVNNPLKFNNKAEALTYLDNNSCPRLEAIDLVVRKNNKDITVPYERECGKKTAYKLFDDDVCNYYMSKDDTEQLIQYHRDLLVLKEQANQLKGLLDTNKLQNIISKKEDVDRMKELNKQIVELKLNFASKTNMKLDEDTDYSIETCMINDIQKEHGDLKDDKFLDNFAKYFDNLNDNIGQSFSLPLRGSKTLTKN